MYQVIGYQNRTDNFNPATSLVLCDLGDIAFNGGQTLIENQFRVSV